MFGKCFSKMYRGSMRGKGPEVFALWPYIIANSDRQGFLELNTELVAFEIGMKPERVEEIIEGFLQPEPKSRMKELEGRKLEKVGEFLYRIVNYEYYRDQKNLDDRRDSNREAAERYRGKKKLEIKLTGKEAEAYEESRGKHYTKRKKVVEQAGAEAGAGRAIKEGFDEATSAVDV